MTTTRAESARGDGGGGSDGDITADLALTHGGLGKLRAIGRSLRVRARTKRPERGKESNGNN